MPDIDEDIALIGLYMISQENVAERELGLHGYKTSYRFASISSKMI